MYRQIRIILPFTAIAFGMVLRSSCAADTTELSHFLTNYPDASKKLKSHFAQVKGELTLTRRERGKPESVVNLTFAVDHGFRKYMRFFENESSNPSIVGCAWDDGTYELSRTRGQRKYSVTGGGETARMRFDESFGAFLAAPYAVLGTPLWDILKAPTFRPIEAHMVREGGKDCLQATYEVAALGRTDSVILDPAWGWVIRRAESTLVSPEGTMKVETAIDYGSTEDGIPSPRRVEISNPRSGAICEFKRFEFQPTPRGEFSMSYYGLPDLYVDGKRAPRRHGAVFWLLATSTAFLLVAFTLRRLASRSRTRDVSSAT